MTRVFARRLRNGSILVAAIAGLLLWYGRQDDPLDQPQRVTGWLLVALVAFLALYSVRKKLAVVPLGSSATWLQWHVYIGLFGIVLFVTHNGWHAPTGTLESVLAVLFVLVTASGLGGLHVSRRIPPRLARRGEEVIYERVPAFIHRLAGRAQELALESVTKTRSRAIADFHAAELAGFLARPTDRLEHILGWGTAHRRREHAMAEFRTCLGPEETPVFDALTDLVRRKEDLDFHRANQGLLKYWFFVHVPLTHALLLFTAAHVVVVHAFGGGR